MLKNLRTAALGPVKNHFYRFNFVAILHALEGRHKYLTTEQKFKTILMYMDKAEIALSQVKNVGAIDRKRIKTLAAIPNQFTTVQSMVFIELPGQDSTDFELGETKMLFSVDIHAVKIFLHESKIDNYGPDFYHWLCTPETQTGQDCHLLSVF